MLSSDNIVLETAALKMPAILRNDQFRKDTKMSQFLKFFIGGNQEKIAQKVGRTRRLQKHPAANPILN